VRDGLNNAALTTWRKPTHAGNAFPPPSPH
jgi:hypothetical protein